MRENIDLKTAISKQNAELKSVVEKVWHFCYCEFYFLNWVLNLLLLLFKYEDKPIYKDTVDRILLNKVHLLSCLV